MKNLNFRTPGNCRTKGDLDAGTASLKNFFKVCSYKCILARLCLI